MALSTLTSLSATSMNVSDGLAAPIDTGLARLDLKWSESR